MKTKRISSTVSLAVMIFSALFFVGLGQTTWLEMAVAETNAQECIPGSGWIWTTRPASVDIKADVENQLQQLGYATEVTVMEFGEEDSCGNFEVHAIDFSINMAQVAFLSAERNDLAQDLSTVLLPHNNPELGIVYVYSPNQDEKLRFVYDEKTKEPRLLDPDSPDFQESLPGMSFEAMPAHNAITAIPSSEIFNLNVYVIVYDPIMSTGGTLSDYMNWNDHAAITQGTIDLFAQVSNNRVNYTVAETTHVDNWADWPEKIDGFQYTEAEYLAVMGGQSSAHSPDNVNYNAIVNNPAFDICGKFNRGEIDEVWIYNGPYFGFYESTLAGPNGYWFNSSPVPGPYDCNGLLPIMGPSPERQVTEAVHNFGHRTESTMSKTYGSWQQNNISHGWNKFGLVDYQSANYDYSGCGSIHYPPNGQSDYDYQNTTNFADTNCTDFVNYPDLTEPPLLTSVNCSAWQCGSLDYLAYWFSNFPGNEDCDTDDVANDWWKYFADPDLPNTPSLPCLPPPTPATVGDRVWYDTNGNGLQDTGEPDVSGVVVNLYDPGADNAVGGGDDVFVDSTMTGRNGRYAFTNIPAQSYYLTIDLPTGYSVTDPNIGSDDSLDNDITLAGNTDVFTLAEGETNDNVDAGFANSQLDYGDLPGGYNNTLLGHDGPRHVVGSLRLGAEIDRDPEGLESDDATGDAYDDGVVPGILNRETNSGEIFINIQGSTASGNADVGVWIDWNNNGAFTTDETYLFPGLTTGITHTVQVTVPDYANSFVYARVRVFDPDNLPGGSLDTGDYLGLAVNGEVEDYRWQDSVTAVSLHTFSAKNNNLVELVLVAGGLLLVVGCFLMILRRDN